MFNPNYIYTIIFFIVVTLYKMGWSDLYPKLTTPTLVFLTATVLLNLFFGFLVKRIYFFRDEIIKYKEDKAGSPKLIAMLLVLWAIDKIFGDIPTVHILLTTFTSFYSIHFFSRYLREHKRDLLVIFLILFFTVSLLCTYRILIFFNLITYLLTYIYIKNPLRSMKGKLIVLISGVSILYVFGYLGNQLKGTDFNDGEFILTIGQASDSFIASKIPNEFFWTYLYASSPLSNLELNIQQKNTIVTPTFKDVFLWINSEFLPDFVSSRTFKFINEEPMQSELVADALNVSTVYVRSYNYMSWFGLIVMAIYIAVFPIIYLSLIKNTKFFIPGLVSLITIYVFLVFDNLFAFSAISFQLVYPLIGKHKLFKKVDDGE